MFFSFWVEEDEGDWVGLVIQFVSFIYTLDRFVYTKLIQTYVSLYI